MERKLILSLSPFSKVRKIYERSEVEFVRSYKRRLNLILLLVFLFMILTLLFYWSRGDWSIAQLTALGCLYSIGYYVYDYYRFKTKLDKWKKEVAGFLDKYEGVDAIKYQYNEREIKQVSEDKIEKEMLWENVGAYHMWEDGIILYDSVQTPILKIPAKLAEKSEYKELETFFKQKVVEYGIKKK